MDPEGIVAFFPSDHFFLDDASFIRHIDSAYTAAVFRPEVVVLLGIAPEAPEIEYGWIEPGLTMEDFASPSLFAVKQLLGETTPETRFSLDGAGMSVEHLHHGWQC